MNLPAHSQSKQRFMSYPTEKRNQFGLVRPVEMLTVPEQGMKMLRRQKKADVTALRKHPKPIAERPIDRQSDQSDQL